jgi:RND superfamily putative drug exporter
MTATLYRLAGFCIRRRVLVLALWLLLAAALVVISHTLGENTNDNLSLPGTDSQHASDTLARSFPDQANGTSPIVLHAHTGKLTEARYTNAVDEAAADVAKDPNVAAVVNPLTPAGASALSKDGSTGYLSVTLAVPPGSLSVQEAEDLFARAQPAKEAGLQVEAGGQLGQKLSKPATESSELIGIVAAIVILTLTFGTFIAALVPILGAVIALAATLAIIRLLGHVTTVPTVAPTLATMIGLGVGIDYALFIVTRHFRGLGEGHATEESIARAVATSGGAVFFAGCTVTIALVSLFVAGTPLVTTMGLMAGIAVIVAVLAALTLLPAALGALGGHINSLRVRAPRDPHEADVHGLWARWAARVGKHPLLAGLAALAILVPLAIPLLSLNLGQADIAALPTSTTARRAYDLIAESFGPGVNGPLVIAVSLGSPAEAPLGTITLSSSGKPPPSPNPSDPRTGDPRLQTLQGDIAETHGVATVTPLQLDKGGTTGYFNAIATTGPAEKATAELVERLREDVIPKAEHGTDMRADVGGSTAGYVDLAARISDKLPLQIIVVIALSFLLLLLAFRTLVIPMQAAAMNLLSIAAAYGVLTLIFQEGWLSGLIGLEGPVPVVSYVPLFMFAVLFGLSMDYEVFLVSQIEEHKQAGEDNHSAVTGGLVTSARVITAAAAIMVFVFGSFVLNGDPTIKQFGVGLAVAVVLDATVVRCLLVPAVMLLAGERNWWLPGWLDRVVPHVSIEGGEFFEVLAGDPRELAGSGAPPAP